MLSAGGDIDNVALAVAQGGQTELLQSLIIRGAEIKESDIKNLEKFISSAY